MLVRRGRWLGWGVLGAVATACGCGQILGFEDWTQEGGSNSEAGAAGVGGGGTDAQADVNGKGGGAGNGAGGGNAGGASTGGGGGGGGETGGMGGSGGAGGSAGSGGGTAGTGGSGGTGGSAGAGGYASAVCSRWKADRASLAEGAWSGNVSSCQAGDVGAPGKENALKLVNLYRWIAGLPPVATDSSRNSGAQKCALMMDANDTLSYSPPTSWGCYDATGATTAGKSNMASSAGVQAVDLYMADPGHETTLGHRRWILSNSLGPIGLGSTDSYSCMWVLGGSGNAGKAWTAWPPPGDFPFEAISVGGPSLDSTGWTLQSDSIGLSNAKVAITDSGADRPVSVTALGPGYGSGSAISMVPKGWAMQTGHAYHVSVTGISPTISYDVNVVACP